MHMICLQSVQSITKNETEQNKFPQENGNDGSSKYLLVEESRKPDTGKTSEVTDARPQDIYQESSKACVKSEKQAENQPEGYSIKNQILRHTESEGLIMMETIPKSSELEDEATSTLPKLEINQGEKVGKGFEQETNEEEESTVIDNDQSCRPQNELEQMSKALKAIDLTQSVGKDAAEKGHTDHQSEVFNMENEIKKHSHLEGKLTKEGSIRSKQDVEELEKTPEAYYVKNSEIKDGGKIMPEKGIYIKEATEAELQKSEIESVLEDRALSTLPTTVSITVEAVEEFQEDMCKEVESPVTNTEKWHRTENDFEKNTVPEVFDLHNAISNTCMEDEKQAENQSEAQSMDNAAIMHSTLEGLENTDISLRSNTEEPEKDPVSHTTQKLVMKDGGNIMREEEKEMQVREEATDMQLVKSATESVLEDEGMEEESTKTENKSNTAENELEQMTIVLQAIDNPKSKAKIDAEMEENAHHQSEASSMENVIIKHINIEGKEMESSSKTTYEIDDEEKNPESHSINNPEIKDIGVAADKALSIHNIASVGVETVEQSNQEEIQNEVESAVTDTKEQQSPENDLQEKTKVFKAFDLHEVKENSNVEDEKKAEIQVEVQNLESIVKHLNLEGETIEDDSSAIDNSNSNQPENELEQTVDIVEVMAEIQQYADHQLEASSMASILTKHINVEEKLRMESNTKSISDVGKKKMLCSVGNSKIEDGGKTMPEEVTDIKQATSVEIQKFNIQSVPEEKVLSTSYTTASFRIQRVEESIQEEIHTEQKIPNDKAQSELPTTVEKILQQQNVQEEESATDDHMCYRPDNKLEKEANAVEETDQTESVPEVDLENEQRDHQSETSRMESLITEHINCEVKMGLESRTKSSCDVDELERILESQLVNNSEILKGMPEDKSPQTLSNTTSVSVEAVDKNIQEIYTEMDSAGIYAKEKQIPKTDFEMKTTVPKVFVLHKLTHQTSVENELKDEPHSEAQNQEITFIKHLNLEGENTEITSTNDTQEQETVPVSNRVEKFEINNDGGFIQQEANTMKGANKMQLLKTISESVPADMTLQTLPTTTYVSVGAFDESNQEEMHTEEKLEMTSTKEGQIPEDDSEEKKRVPKAFDLLEVTHQTIVENEMKVEHQSEMQNQEITMIKLLCPEGETAEINTTNDTEKQLTVPATHTGEKIEIEDDGIFIQEEANETEEANEMQLQQTASESVPENMALETLPTTTYVGAGAFHESDQDEMNPEEKLEVTNTKEEHIPEDDSEEKKRVPKAFDLHEVTHQTITGNEMKAEPPTEMQNRQNTMIELLNLEGETAEINPTNDTVKQQTIPTTHTGEKLEIKRDGNFIQEEAKGREEENEMQSLQTASKSMPKDMALQTLPTTTYVGARAFDESNQEKMNAGEELEVTTPEEMHILEDDSEEKKSVPKGFGLHEVTIQTIMGNDMKAESQTEMKNQQTVMIELLNIEGETAEINPTNDTEKQQMVPATHMEEKLEIERDENFIQEKEKGREDANEMQSLQTASESVLEDMALQTLPTTTNVGALAFDESNQEEMHTEEELEVTTIKGGHNPEDDSEEEKRLPKAFDLHEVTRQTIMGNEMKDESQSEMQNQQTTMIQLSNLIGEIAEVNPATDTEKQQTVPATHTGEKLEIDLHEVTHQTIMECEMKAEPQSEVQNQVTTMITHLNLEGDSAEINLINNNVKQQTVPAPHTGEKEEIEDDGNFIQEQANETEEENEMQLLQIASESVPKDMALQTLPTTTYVGTRALDESNRGEMHKEVEVTTTKEGQIPEDDTKEKMRVPKEDLYEVTHQTITENEKKAKPQSEVQNQETPTIKHLNLEGETAKINPTNDTQKQQKIPASHTGEYLEIKDDGNFIQEEAKEREEATELQLKTVTESLPEDGVQSTMLTSAIVKGDIEDLLQKQSLNNNEITSIDNHKSCTEENKLEKMADVEEIDQLMGKVDEENEEKADQQSEESTMQSMITKHINEEQIVTSEGSTKLSYKKNEQEKIVDSHLVKELESTNGVPNNKVLQTLPDTLSIGIEAVDESSQEERHTKVKLAVRETTEEQIPENDFEEKRNIPKAFDLHEVTCQSSAESELKVEPEEQNQEITFINHQILEGEAAEINTKLLTSAIVESDIAQILKQQTLHDDELAATDNNSCRQENDLEKMFNAEVIKENNKHLDHSEASSMQSLSTKIIKAEGIVTPESSTKSSYDADKLENVVNLHSVQNFKSKDGCTTTEEEATDPKHSNNVEIQTFETESVPEDKAMQMLLDTASVKIEAVGESTQEAKLVVTNVIDWQAFGRHKVTHQPNPENELKSEPISEGRNEITFVKHQNLEGETTEVNPSNNCEQEENITQVHNRAKLENEDDKKFIQAEAKQLEEETEMQFVKTAAESLPEDEVQSTLPTSAIFKGDTEEILQQQTFDKDKSVTIDITKSCRQENEVEEMASVVEANDQLETMAHVDAENEEHANNQSEASSMQSLITKHINAGVVTLESSSNSGIPQDKDLQTLPNTAFISIEEVNKTNQEDIHKGERLDVMDPKEEQIPENHFVAKKSIPEAFNQHGVRSQPTVENDLKAEPQSEVQNQKMTYTNHLNLEGETTEINPTNDIEEREKAPPPHSREELEIEEDEKLTQEEAKGMTKGTEMQLLKAATQSLPEDEVQSTLPASATVQCDTQQILQKQIIQDDDSAAIHSSKSCRQESELQKMSSIVGAFDQIKTIAKDGTITEGQAYHQSETSSMQSRITNYINAEGIVTSESSTDSSFVADEQEKTVYSHLIENLETKDGSKISAQEATDTKQLTDVETQKSETESVPENKALQTLPNAALVGNKAVDETSQEEIQTEVELELTCTKESQIPENDFDAKKDTPEAYGVYEVSCRCNADNELNAASFSEAQNQEITLTNHMILDGETTEINSINNTKEPEKVPVSHTEEKLGIEDGGKFIQEEVKRIKEATKIQLLKTATESLPNNEVHSTLPTSSIIQGDTKHMSQLQTIHDDESTINDNDKSCIQENEPERTSNVLEEINPAETMANISVVKEEQADHLSETSSMQSVIVKYIKAEGNVTSESSKKTSYDAEGPEKTVDSHSIQNLESKDGSKLTAQEAMDTKQLTGMHGDKSLQTLPNAATVDNETVEKSSQVERHAKAEVAVTYTQEGQIPRSEFDSKKDIPEVHGVYEVKHQLSVENELKAESKFETQNQETTFLKHLYSDRETAKINPTNDTEEHEKVPMSQTEEKLGIKDDEKFIQEEAKGIKGEIESLPKDEVQSTLTTSAIVQCDNEQILQQQTLHANESAVIENDKSSTQVNEHEKSSNVLEVNDQTKYMAKMDVVKEEQTDHLSEASSMQSVITKYFKAEGIETSTSSTKASYDADEQEKAVHSHSVENLKDKDGSKIIAQEATNTKQLTDVEIQKSETECMPENKAWQTLRDAASVSNEAGDKSNQEEIHLDMELAVICITEGQMPKVDFETKYDIPEAFGLQKVAPQLSVEKDFKAQPQSEVQSQDTAFIKHPNLEEKTEINPTNDAEEQDKFPASHIGNKLGTRDDGKFIQKEAKGMDEATELQLLNTKAESLPKDEEVQSKLPTYAVVNGDTEEILQQQILQDQSPGIDNNKSFRQESELNVVQEIDQLETIDMVGEEKEEHVDHQLEALSMQGSIAKQINVEGIVTSESSIKSSYDVDELEKIVESHSVKNLESKDDCKITAEEATDMRMRQLTHPEIQISETQTLVSIEEVDKHIQEIHTEAELALTDTKEGQISEDDFETFPQHEESCQTSMEKEQKAELLVEHQSEETTIIKHPNLDGETTEIKPTNDTEEHEKIPVSHAREKSEINDYVNFIQEKAKEMEEPTEKSLLKTVTESVPEDEAQSTLPTVTIVKGDRVERIFQEQMLKEEELAVTDNNNSCRPKDEIEQMANVVETIDQPKTMVMVSPKNEQHADHQSEQSSMDNAITKNINSEGMVTTEKAAESSYEMQEQEKVLGSDSIDNSEIKDGEKIKAEEATDIKEARDMEFQKLDIESVPEDKAISTLSTIPCVRVEKVEERIQDEIQKEAESTMTDAKEWQRPENDLVENMKVLEIPEPPYTITKLETYFDSEAHNQNIEQPDQTKEKSTNIQDQISESDDHIQGEKVVCEIQTKPESQMEGEHYFSIQLHVEPTSAASLTTNDVHAEVDRAGEIENIEEQTIDSEKSIPEVQILSAEEDKVNQVKDHNVENFKTTYSNEQGVITESSFENDLTGKEAASRDFKEAIKEQAITGKPKTQELKATQLSSMKEDFEKISPSTCGTIISVDSQDADSKVLHKKSHGILSGVGSKVKHSISKMKKAITGKSSHPKTPTQK